MSGTLMVDFKINTEQLQKACEDLGAMFAQLGEALIQISKVFSDLFASIKDKVLCETKPIKPDKYGMSLIKQPYKSISPRYNYKPVTIKNMPYQRRNY